jgi:16S rRNA processing protein RimM
MPKTIASQNTPDEKFVIVGRLGRPHGIQGWMRIISFTEPEESILNYPEWFIARGDLWEPIELEEYKLQSGMILVKFPGCDNPEQARLYTNANIAITRDQLPSLDENDFYWTDLEGLTVINKQGAELGVIDHLFATGSNDVMVVKGVVEHLVPYIKHVILEVDLKNKRMLVDWEEDF